MTLVCVVTRTAGACRPAGTTVSRELNGLHALPLGASWRPEGLLVSSGRMALPGGAELLSMCPVVTVGFAWLVPGLPVQEHMEHSPLAVGQR